MSERACSLHILCVSDSRYIIINQYELFELLYIYIYIYVYVMLICIFVQYNSYNKLDEHNNYIYIYIYHRFIVRFPIALDFLFITYLLHEC